jgi:CheY-like chemotaxis protein
MAEARQKFLTHMSHELRTPLNAVMGFSELLKGEGLTTDQAQWAGRINQAGGELLGVVNEMIRLSELDSWTGDAATTASLPERPLTTLPERLPFEGGRGLRVLYVDDNEANRALVSAVLTAQGFDCQTADDGREGVAAAQAGGWDLILMDIQMPVMNGVDACRAIRALPGPAGAIPILALTANTLDVQLREYAAAGMDDTIAKPVNVAELLAKVWDWCDATSRTSAIGTHKG